MKLNAILLAALSHHPDPACIRYATGKLAGHIFAVARDVCTAWISDLADGALSVIDTASARVIRTIAVSSPAEAEVDYASGSALRRLTVGKGGDGMAILP